MGRPQFSSSVSVTNETSNLGVGTIYDVVTVGTSAAELKVGATPLIGRAAVYIQCDDLNSAPVYLGWDNTVTETKYAIKLSPGQLMTLTLVQTADVPIFAISSAAGQKVALTEVNN